jgi:predicted DNA-binding transcriptional regulator YafY
MVRARGDFIENLISDAIKSCKVIEFYYDGLLRTVEPYTYGSTSRGEDALRAYQVSGDSVSGQQSGWKLFKLMKINNLSEVNENFEPRSEYRLGDSAFSNIFCEINR